MILPFYLTDMLPNQYATGEEQRANTNSSIKNEVAGQSGNDADVSGDESKVC